MLWRTIMNSDWIFPHIVTDGYTIEDLIEKFYEEGGEFFVADGNESALAYSLNMYSLVPVVLVKDKPKHKKFVKIKNSI